MGEGDERKEIVNLKFVRRYFGGSLLGSWRADDKDEEQIGNYLRREKVSNDGRKPLVALEGVRKRRKLVDKVLRSK